MQWNLIKCYCLASHSSVFGNRLIKCFYIRLFWSWQKIECARAHLWIAIMRKVRANERSVFGVCRYYYYSIPIYILRLHETLIGIDSNSFSWFLSSPFESIHPSVSFESQMDFYSFFFSYLSSKSTIHRKFIHLVQAHIVCAALDQKKPLDLFRFC